MIVAVMVILDEGEGQKGEDTGRVVDEEVASIGNRGEE